MNKTIPIKKKIFSQPFAVVGLIIEKDSKFLLVQEAKKEVGMWNQPAGWIDLNEDILAAALREGQEETGLKLELTSLLGIYSFSKVVNKTLMHPVKFIFSAKIISGKLNYDTNEIMDARWFTIEEIKDMECELRDKDIIDEIEDYLTGKSYPLEVIKPWQDFT